MDLTTQQNDALTELINIGFGRAASALSDLSGFRVSLEVPRITMHAVEQIGPLIGRLVTGEVASVNQVFNGAIAGNALLMLDEKSATMLSRLLSEDSAVTGGFDASGQEIIIEVGNILLNACLSVFGDLLQVRVSFAVPRLQVAGIGSILKTLLSESEELHHGMVIHTHFHLQACHLTGYLIIILGISSFERMLQELQNWEKRQISC